MEAFESAVFGQVANRADLIMPEGRSLAWALKSEGARNAFRVRGTDLMMCVVECAAYDNISIGLYGGTPELLEALAQVLDE